MVSYCRPTSWSCSGKNNERERPWFFLNLIVGLIGSVIGGWVYNLLGVQSTGSVWGTLVMSTIGAIVLLYILSLLKKK